MKLRLPLLLAALALTACGNSATPKDDLQVGDPVEWPAPTEPGFVSPTTDPNQDYGIFGP